MPKLYEYLGIVVFFYSNEHEPVHVHGRYQGKENRAEVFMENGRVLRVEVKPVHGREPLDGKQRKQFEQLVKKRAKDIVGAWVDYFVYNKRIEFKRLS